MISRKLSKVADERIIDFLNNGYARTDEDGLFETVESISDLWVFANMKLSNTEIEDRL